MIVQDQDKPRNFWKLTIVEHLIRGSDDRIRGAYVRTHDQGNKPIITMKRPVQRLYPLEIRSVDDSCTELSAKSNETTSDTENEDWIKELTINFLLLL